MADQHSGGLELPAWDFPQVDESHSHSTSSRTPWHCADSAQPSSALPRRRSFFVRAALFAVIAVLGEFAALTAASALHLGVTGTWMALAGVVLSAMWPLARSAM